MGGIDARGRNAALGAMASVLARLYKEPFDGKMIACFRELDVDDADDLFLANGQFREGAAQLKAFFSQDEGSGKAGSRADASVRSNRQLASDDFHKLFVGPLKLKAAPWSSVYLDLGSLFGPTALAVEKEFKRHGFAIPEGKHEPCDHIAYELEFLGEMHRAAEAAWQVAGGEDVPAESAAAVPDSALAPLTDARAFKKTYLDPWADAFFQAVDEGARYDAYRAVASMTRGFLAIEEDFLFAVVPSGDAPAAADE